MADRVDADGAAYAGSQLQMQLYVNRRVTDLNGAIQAVFPELASRSLEWKSPVADDGYREYWDRRFLDRVGLGRLSTELKQFWPTGGPHWDALGTFANGTGEPGLILVEAKSHVQELYGGGCGAAPGSDSRKLIERSLAWTQRQVGAHARTPADWCGPLYQTANRLAHLCWLRAQGVDAWLVYVLFTDDPRSPTTEADWIAALKDVDATLGLDTSERPNDHAGHVWLKAGTRADLVA